MRENPLDQLALMPESEAVSRYFAARNYGLVVWTWPLATLVYFGVFIAAAVNGRVFDLAVAAAGLAGLLLVFFFRTSDAFASSFHAIFTAYLILVPLGIVKFSDDSDFGYILTASFAPFFLLLTRLKARHLALVAAIYIATSFMVGYARKGELTGDVIAPALVTNVLFAGTSMFITRRKRIAFLREWSHAAGRELERERMREELADARKIQLAMLPASPPEIDWLDLSSVSLPATEVGGDFYEYFKLDDDRVVIAIGDVAGHGVGSGLVLAGIKSGLHLLREELIHPVDAVRRLNRVASEWLQWRMLVTLLVAVVDRRERVVRVVCAGHPPMLLARDGECLEIGRPALPLGTRLDPSFAEESVPIREGDAILVYTDGVTELQDRNGEAYGDERLQAVFRDAVARDCVAAEVRESLLSAVSAFKDRSPQQDDLSFVVARIGDL